MRLFSVGALVAAIIVLAAGFFLIQKITHEEEHIHAIAFDPSEPGVYYFATHHVLVKHGKEVKEVGEYGTDYMGFTIASDGTFYSSGHSREVEDLGFRKSVDKGLSWQTVAYEGEDFHDIVTPYADPNVIYAWDTPPHSFLTVSRDGGKTWSERNTTGIVKSFFSLGADHQESGIVYAATLYGVYMSKDYGVTWEPIKSLENIPTVVVADDPKDSGVMYVSTNKKGVLKTEDNGLTWKDFSDGLPNASEDIVVLISINPTDSSGIFALLKHGDVYRHNGNRWVLTNLGIK